MNNQKVEQSLRQILDECGEEIIHDHNRFQSAVFDLLDKINDSEERLVLKHAMDSNAFWMLLETTQITADSAKKAIEQIQKESHMAREDAEFVVRCVVSVSGINQDAVMEEAVQEPVASKEEQRYETKTPVQVAKEPAHVEYDSSNKKNKKIIGVTAAAVCLMVLAILLVSYHGSAPEAGQTTSEKQVNPEFLPDEELEKLNKAISDEISNSNIILE